MAAPKLILTLGAKRLLAGLTLLAAVGAGIGLYLFEGGYDVAAAQHDGQAFTWVVHGVMIHSVKARAAKTPAPAAFTPAQVQAGFEIYDRDCAVCHGGPGVGRAAWVAGMNPTPPYIIDSARHWSASDLRLIVGDGVRMTAMPAWRGTLTEAQVWDVVGFLEALPDTSPDAYARRRGARKPTGPTA
jgi:mono/diheme cytochrome c family protein